MNEQIVREIAQEEIAKKEAAAGATAHNFEFNCIFKEENTIELQRLILQQFDLQRLPNKCS
jgi:hypothetical protein